MRLVIDIETNGLENPDKVWCVVAKDIDTGRYFHFRNLHEDENECIRLRELLREGDQTGHLLIGHNFLGFDWPVLVSALELHREVRCPVCVDTLIVSKLVNYSRPGHSLEDYGLELGFEKIKFNDFSQWSQELETYCKRDVDLTELVFRKFEKILNDPQWKSALKTEHDFQLLVNSLHDNGFHFNKAKAEKLLGKVREELAGLDVDILGAFPPQRKVIREFTPKLTKHGTISRTSVPRKFGHLIPDLDPGRTYKQVVDEAFNPSSHKQLIGILANSGWRPTDRTTTHIATEREIQRLRYARGTQQGPDEAERLKQKLEGLKITGWKINETNLLTLPSSAPAPARLLARRILLEARRRTLTEWLALVSPDSRIHGKFYGLGAWTHRMAHQNPNTANIPTDAKLYGGEMRSLWCAPRNRLLVGVDAEGIQLRIFAHYIDDPEFTRALVEGKKDDKSDPHSLNQRILGAKSRNIAKRFIFAYLLGGGIGKLSEILEVSEGEGKRALERLLGRYQGLQFLKDNVIPRDARRGYFEGLDGRLVRLPGDSPGERKHLCMSGYLQNGEAIVMKRACLLWHEALNIGSKHHWLNFDRKWSSKDIKFVNFVHDEWQTEVSNNLDFAIHVAKTQAKALELVGKELGLLCPLAGSYWNDDNKDYTIGVNWKQTH